jgi:hypothetical protein
MEHPPGSSGKEKSTSEDILTTSSSTLEGDPDLLAETLAEAQETTIIAGDDENISSQPPVPASTTAPRNAGEDPDSAAEGQPPSSTPIHTLLEQDDSTIAKMPASTQPKAAYSPAKGLHGTDKNSGNGPDRGSGNHRIRLRSAP